jgi:cell division protein FtsL
VTSKRSKATLRIVLVAIIFNVILSIFNAGKMYDLECEVERLGEYVDTYISTEGGQR